MTHHVEGTNMLTYKDDPDVTLKSFVPPALYTIVEYEDKHALYVRGVRVKTGTRQALTDHLLNNLIALEVVSNKYTRSVNSAPKTMQALQDLFPIENVWFE